MLVIHRLLPVLFAAVLLACGDPKGVQVVRLDVSASGDYSLVGKAVSGGDLATKLTELSSSSSIVLHIAVDEKASHQSVVGALDAAKIAGIGRISFVHSPDSSK